MKNKRIFWWFVHEGVVVCQYWVISACVFKSAFGLQRFKIGAIIQVLRMIWKLFKLHLSFYAEVLIEL